MVKCVSSRRFNVKMNFSTWLQCIDKAKKTTSVLGNIRTVYYRFLDGREMIEEYNIETGIVLKRAWKVKSRLIRKDEWEIELGDSKCPIFIENEPILKEAETEPVMSKRITRNVIEWRISNLPYPLATYTISCNGSSRTLTIKTTNNKFFKKIDIPEFHRCMFEPKQEDLTVNHRNSTLILTYKKPLVLLEMEKAVLLKLQDVETLERVFVEPYGEITNSLSKE
ncbi:protein DPCD-like isoform X1 [Anopheles albimanus]|uniref:protein DPCD-like isoform X1 n=2 Tax=Anopheles albimanus TaxID=7167 RepID=UPI001641DBE0|nr:protein DPCD-like isoform X1 [Anopheles albimanus]